MSTSPTPDLDHVDNTTLGPIRPATSDGRDSERSVDEVPVWDPSHPEYTPLFHTSAHSPQPHVSLASVDIDKSVLRQAHSAVTVPAGQLHGNPARHTSNYKIIQENPPKEAENVEKALDSDDSDDPEESCNYVVSLPAGFPRLAEFMTRGPERALFRTFRTLGVQNLLYMQAELDYLEWDLRSDMEDEQNARTTAKYATDWAMASNQSNNGVKPKQCHIIMEIRQKLEKYGILDQ